MRPSTHVGSLAFAKIAVGLCMMVRCILGALWECRVWLPFLNTYRTMCLAPKPEFRCVLEEIRVMWPAA